MKQLIWIIDEEWADYDIEKSILNQTFPNCTIRNSSYDYMKDLEEFGCRADGILCQVYAELPREVIQQLDKCKGIAVYGGGYDRVDTKAAREVGISVTNVSNYCKEDLADYVMASIYHFNKQILSFNEAMHEGLWGAQAIGNPVRRIGSSTLMVIGLGRIGKTVALKGISLGMKVVAYDPYISSETMAELGVEKVAWEQGLKNADFISINAILTPETEGLMTYKDFQKMKPSAYLINTARGKIIKEQDLISAVKNRIIAGAALDVIEIEPPTLKEAIFKCPGIIVTPHISYISQESFSELKHRSVQNLIDMMLGRVPQDLVN